MTCLEFLQGLRDLIGISKDHVEVRGACSVQLWLNSDLQTPGDLPCRTQWRLLGNSVNVSLVAHLIDELQRWMQDDELNGSDVVL